MDPSDDNGVTLIELLVTLSLAAVLSGLATGAYVGYARSSRQSGTVTQIQSMLRNTAERSLSEGRTYCVSFDTTAGTWTIYRKVCGPTPGVLAEGPFTVDTGIRLASVAFTIPTGSSTTCPTPGTCAYFYPRGTASPGGLQVRSSSSKVYSIDVKGLTSRVSFS